MGDLCVRAIPFLGEIRDEFLSFPSWEGLGVGFLSIPLYQITPKSPELRERGALQMLFVSPDKAKPVVRQGRKATELGILEFRV